MSVLGPGSGQSVPSDGGTAAADPWKSPVLALEGGGTRGYASLLMLRGLMDEIARLEQLDEAPMGVDGTDWEPHNSSFGRIESIAAANGVIETATLTQTRLPPTRQNSAFSTTAIAQQMEERKMLTRHELDMRIGKYLPCHYFDYIGGTSTGGLAALMLGRLRMSTEECISRYPEMAKRIFRTNRIAFWGFGDDRFDANVLQKEIEDIIAERLGPEETDPKYRKMASPEDVCKTAVVAKVENTNREYIFRSYSNITSDGFNPDNPGPAHEHEIWQVGRATSAAPNYFEAICIDEEWYVDGGLGDNDPSWAIYNDIWSHKRVHRGEPSPISLFLTLGTGLKPTLKARAKRQLGWARLKRHFNILKQAAVAVNKVERYMQEQRDEFGLKYYKWKGGEEVGALPMHKWKPQVFHSMEDWVRRFMDQAEVQMQMKEVAVHLVNKRRQRYRENRDKWERFTFCTMLECPLKKCTQADLKFKTKEEALAHIQSSHGRLEHHLTVDDIPIIEPWGRGPWCQGHG